MEIQLMPLIRQGWLRAFIYSIAIVLVLIAFQTLGNVISQNIFTEEKQGVATSFTGFIISYIVIAVGIFVITLIFRKFIDRASFKSLGFTWKGFETDAWIGFFTGPAILGLGTIILILTGYLSFIDSSLDATALLLEVFIMIVVTFTEEVLFRGYLLNNLLQSMNKWVALLVTSVLFAIFHGANPNISFIAVINIFIAGLLIGINYIYTRNLWFAIFFHFSWNFFQGPVFGYDVSGLDLHSIFQQTLSGPEQITGGQFGFEGSLLCAALTAVATGCYAYVFHKKYNVTVHPDTKQVLTAVR